MEPATLSLRYVTGALTSGEGVMTHVRTLGYFTAFLGSLGTVLAHFPWSAAWRERPLLLSSVPFSLSALFATWRLILAFMVAFQATFASHPDPPNLFVEAYALVCDAARMLWARELVPWSWVGVLPPPARREGLARAQRRRAHVRCV